jgi:hypothetical protein
MKTPFAKGKAEAVPKTNRTRDTDLDKVPPPKKAGCVLWQRASSQADRLAL